MAIHMSALHTPLASLSKPLPVQPIQVQVASNLQHMFKKSMSKTNKNLKVEKSPKKHVK
jgi:hypothetical protein